MRSVYVVGAKRTAFGTFGGSLKDRSATELATDASRAALTAAGVEPARVDHVVFGNVQQTSRDASYLARHVGLKVQAPQATPALTLNRLCGSGFQAAVTGAQLIQLGEAEVVLAGGTENMSQAPHAMYGGRWGMKLGTDVPLIDTLWAGLTDLHCDLPMGITAENLADRYEIDREACDAYALRSQTAWSEADRNDWFSSEICRVEIDSRKGPIVFARDEHPRETSSESLAKLKPVFRKDGRVTAGNASGICDGAAALILASEEAVGAHGLTPLARIVAWGVVGVDPSVMGIGPAPAIRKTLKRSGHDLSDMDRVEVNEAFAAQYLAVERELELDRDKTNVHGGAIALGHPLGASGARILTHLVHELRRIGGRRALGSACIGGGQGIAVEIEAA
jgi:acetyl-CoA acyltransferase 2